MVKKIHFVGIGGIGVSALAQYYKARGWRVSGSDAAASPVTAMLKECGIKIFIGHKKSQMAGTSRVVYSAAISADNPELTAARRAGIPILSYAQAVGELTKKYYTLAVAGSHGKSTTTALLGLLLVKAGLDPTIIVGTKLRELGDRNFRLGHGKYLVLEADEFSRSFHQYYPHLAVVTNIDAEHLDTYQTLRGVIAGFKRYLRNVPQDGYIVANASDAAVRSAVKGIRGPKVIFFTDRFSSHRLSIPGVHNQLNAEAAWQAARVLGIKRELAEKVFSAYKGAWRRLEELQPRVFSDYAHHPTEIRATLQALREQYPHRRIICVFQPHHQDRLTRLFHQFKKAFNGADATMLLPLYKVAGRELGGGKTSQDLCAAIGRTDVIYEENMRSVFRFAAAERKKGSVAVFMSAGDLDAKARKRFGGKGPSITGRS